MIYGFSTLQGDIEWAEGSIVLLEEPIEALRQLLESRLRLAAGEWFLDPEEGLTLYENILGKPRTAAQISSAMRTRIEATPGVTNILELNVDISAATRTVSIDFVVQTEVGLITNTLIF